MCKFIGKSNERILCKLSKSKILRLYSIVHVAMETTKTSHFTCQSKSFISIFFTCQVSACELQPFSCHDFANDICSQTVKTVFSHLNGMFCTHSKMIFSPWNDKKMVLLHGIFRYTTKGMISYQSLRTTKMNFENLLGEQVFKITIAIRFKLQSSSLSIRASFCILAFVIYTLNVWILINFVTKWF